MGLIPQLLSSGEDFKDILTSLCFFIPAMLLSLILHECAHAIAAYWSGDDTAKLGGRISLNPLDHLSLTGTLCMLFIGFGWAKPVPVDPRKMKHPRKDMIWVSLAGILINFILFIVSTMLIVILCKAALPEKFIRIVGMINSNVNDGYRDYVNANGSCFWNLYSGRIDMIVSEIKNIYGQSSIISQNLQISHPNMLYFIRFFMIFSMMNLGLALFNFLPVPPLDGYNFWNLVLFKGKIRITRKTTTIILIIFYGFLLFGDRIFGFNPLSKLIYTVQGIFADLFLMIF